MDTSLKNELDTAETRPIERRSANRASDDADWESKVLGRVQGHLRNVPQGPAGDQQGIGWEASVLDILRRRIERGPV